MPVRVPLVTDPAARVLLDGIVDYAGLFPPASLSVAEAVRLYARYRGGEAGWMLGRFVCPVASLDDFAREAEPLLPRDAGAIPWRISAIGSGNHEADAIAITALNDAHRWTWDECSAIVDTIETRATTPADIASIHEAFESDTQVFVEIPWVDDVTPFIAELARVGRRAKMRTGGITADAFPSPSAMVSFIDCCVLHGVAFKATAGLHHPLHGTYPLTYAPDAPQGSMYGYLNVFLVAAMTAQGLDRHVRERALQSSDDSQVVFADEFITWQNVRFDRTELAQVRERIAISFGSCSFTEPVNEVRALGAW